MFLGLLKEACFLAPPPFRSPGDGNDLVEMQLHFAVQHPPQTLDEAARLVVALADAGNLFQACPRGRQSAAGR
jgi:hypothetical protein